MGGSSHLRRVGHVGDVRGDAQALRQSRGFAKTLRFRDRRSRDIQLPGAALSTVLLLIFLR